MWKIKSCTHFPRFGETHDAGGLRGVLGRADRRFALPPEVRDYLTSHFRMVREENSRLRREAEDAEEELRGMRDEHRDCREVR